MAISGATHVAYDNLVAWINTTAWDQLPMLRPGWYRRAVSAVMLLIAEESPEYVTASLDASVARLLVFTRSRVVLAECEPAERESSVRVTARPRSGLRTVSASSTAAFRTDSWPGRVRVHVTYDDGTSFELPLEEETDDLASGQVVAFLPSLLENLA